jgi:hypothetical protein
MADKAGVQMIKPFMEYLSAISPISGINIEGICTKKNNIPDSVYDIEKFTISIGIIGARNAGYIS